MQREQKTHALKRQQRGFEPRFSWLRVWRSTAELSHTSSWSLNVTIDWFETTPNRQRMLSIVNVWFLSLGISTVIIASNGWGSTISDCLVNGNKEDWEDEDRRNKSVAGVANISENMIEARWLRNVEKKTEEDVVMRTWKWVEKDREED